MSLIVKMIFGAHLYGTATDDSDVDYRGVFLPTREQILLGKIPKSKSFSTGNDVSKNNPDDIDQDFYSLHHFIKLACEGQTVAMDMLHAIDETLIVNSEIWQQIIRQRHRFYSKNLKAFIDYARRQTAKYGIKGSRLNSASKVLELLNTKNPEHKLRTIWDQLPRIEHCCGKGKDPNGMRLYQVCGKTFQESAAIGYVAAIIEKFYDDYGHRAKLATKNKNIDWKAVSHAMRAAIQVREILTLNTIRYPLKDAPYLLKVKQGLLDYGSEVAPKLESLMDEVEGLIDKSSLPEKTDTAYWDQFICETLEAHHFRKVKKYKKI
ncbi:MAG: hypothetical protein GY874_01260 [Desulfobacteraceae bacterium]|nr:hypothetical protein [Desulfobacteraceae bacterium]